MIVVGGGRGLLSCSHDHIAAGYSIKPEESKSFLKFNWISKNLKKICNICPKRNSNSSFISTKFLISTDQHEYFVRVWAREILKIKYLKLILVTRQTFSKSLLTVSIWVSSKPKVENFLVLEAVASIILELQLFRPNVLHLWCYH